MSLMHVTVATYNIHAGIGTDGQFHPQRIAHVLNELQADIIALQEVEHHAVGSLDFLDYLARESGLSAIPGPTLQRGARHYGNALLTRYPIASVSRIDLTCFQCEPRGAIDTILDCNGRQVHIVATHLGLKPRERRRQVRHLLTLFEDDPSDVAVLLGDLNEWFLWGRVLRWLHGHFHPTPTHATYPSRWPILALDRLWVRPYGRLSRLEAHTSDLARCASDHLPLKAVIAL